MNDTTVKMMEYPPRLQMSMLGPVREIAASIPEGDKEVRVIGYVFGEARGVSYRNNPNSTDGEAATALTGAFEGVPSYADYPGMHPDNASSKRAGLASGVIFLPPQAQAIIVSQVRGPDDDIPATPKRGQRVDKLGVVVPISLEIGIRKSGSPVGYEWVTRGLANVKAQSPLERMRTALGLPVGSDLQARIADGTLAKIVTGADAKQLENSTDPAPMPDRKISKKPASKKR